MPTLKRKVSYFAIKFYHSEEPSDVLNAIKVKSVQPPVFHQPNIADNQDRRSIVKYSRVNFDEFQCPFHFQFELDSARKLVGVHTMQLRLRMHHDLLVTSISACTR